MARATNGQVEALIGGYILKEHPQMKNSLEVEFSRRYQDRTFQARISRNRVKLSFHVAPRDPEFKKWLNRARKACRKLYYRNLVGTTGISDQISGKRKEAQVA